MNLDLKVYLAIKNIPMSEATQPKSYEDLRRENLEKNQERVQRMEAVRQQTIERLTTDPAIQQYFQQFNDTSVPSFISMYATLRSTVLEDGDFYEQIGEEYCSEYFERAKDCLREIQLKKLFHLRCEWGAELITLEGISTTSDFLGWSADVLNCPLLSPISPEEFELYLQYAKSHHFGYIDFFNWLDVENLRADNSEEEDFCSWFHYHHTHTNSGMYLLLPDKRRKKEKFYRKLYSQEQEAIREKKYETGELKRPVQNHAPLLNIFNYEQLMIFMTNFEDADTIRAFKNYEQYGNELTIASNNEEDQHLSERANDIIHKLSCMKDVILPVEASDDWRKALISAWDNYEKEQTIAYLTLAYDDYLFRVENKIKFPEQDAAFCWSLAENARKEILRGRELNGEPADFNF